jgi:glycosyltransferase involved in cell wall biosynthesis
MKILILNWRDIKHPLGGGAEISLHEQAKEWIKKGAKVTWFSASFPRAKEKEEIDGIKIIRRGSAYTVHIEAYKAYKKDQLKNFNTIIDCFHGLPFFSPMYIKNTKIIALINEPAKNVWFKNVIFPLSLLAYLAEPTFFIPYRKLPFITGSESIQKELTHYAIPLENINVVHHGITIKKLKQKYEKEKKPTVIYLAPVSQDKGIEDAIKAVAQLKKEKVQLWVVGKAPDKNYLDKVIELTKNLGIADRVTFWGFVSQEKKFELLSKAWMLAHPSIREGWGLNVIEANAYGTPAVGYNIVGLRDSIVDKKTGILVDTNSTALANGINTIIKNKTLYKDMMENAKKWSKNFTWQKSAERSLSVITSVQKS